MNIKEAIDLSQHLISAGEKLEPLDLGGWIVLRNQLKPGDEVIVCWDQRYRPAQFKKPFRAVVDNVSSNNLLGLTAKTEVVTKYGVYPPGPISGWLDVMDHAYIVRETE